MWGGEREMIGYLYVSCRVGELDFFVVECLVVYDGDVWSFFLYFFFKFSSGIFIIIIILMFDFMFF